uniref:Zinc transporter ZIP13 n=1 Tax=Ciona savignyi TaxID=51511 RepID=H2Z2P0_CIOSA
MKMLCKLPFLFHKYLITSTLLIGLVSPTEPILSIHRAGRTDILDEQTLSNNTFHSLTIPNVQVDKHDTEELVRNTTDVVEFSRTEASILALLSAGLVGMSGIFPLIILPKINGGFSSNTGTGSAQLQRLLSFAVGGLLGDVFLHLLPESWDQLKNSNQDGSHTHWPAVDNGLWVLIGLISFCLLEKLFPDDKTDLSNQHVNVQLTSETRCKSQHTNGFNR